MSSYLDLLKLVMTGYAFPESSDQVIRRGQNPAKNLIIDQLSKRGLRLVKHRAFDELARMNGKDWPSIAYSMVGVKRLNNVEMAIKTALAENIPGDVIECGVWRGGCSMFMRAVMNENGGQERMLWLSDSFDGMPKPNASRYPADEGYDLSENDYLSVPLETVQENFKRFGFDLTHTRFLKGWFKDTLPAAPIKSISVLRADGDLYESTMDILNNLYARVSPGGFVIMDDYFAWEPCRVACTEFRSKHSVTSPIIDIDRMGAYWRK